ncbi:MAG: DMT family transporter [Victivallaceae bacterium]|nr:DMT family transporter [Victivallaceae bacterium]
MLNVAPFVVPILLSAVALGFYDIAKKSSVNGNAVMPALFFSTLSGAILFTAIAALNGTLADAVFCSAKEYLLLWGKAILVGTSWICSYYALRELPITIAAPIRASSPLWTLLGATLLYRECPSRYQATGMAMIFIGYVFFTLFGKKEGFRPTSRGMVMILLATLLGSSSTLYDKYLLGVLAIPRGAVQFHFCVDSALFTGIVALLLLRGKDSPKFVWRWSIPATGLLVVLSDYFYFKAVSTPGAAISILAMLRRCNVFIPFLYGCFFWREVNRVRKMAALIVILLGAALLALTR